MDESPKVQADSNTTNSIMKAYNEYNSLRIRLDTTTLLDQIELFLRGAKIIIEQDQATGKIVSRKVKIGKAKANDEGVQSLLNWFSSTINPSTVQGNFPIDKSGFSSKYEDYIYEYHVELTSLLVQNCYAWEIDEDEIDGIIEFVILLVIPFMSRLIDNKERESYYETIKSIESSSVLRGKGTIPLINQ